MLAETQWKSLVIQLKEDVQYGVLLFPVPKRQQERGGESGDGNLDLQKAEIMGRFAAAQSCALQLLIHGRRAGGKMEWSELYHGWLVQGQTCSWVQLIKLAHFTVLTLGVWRMRGWGGRAGTALLKPGWASDALGISCNRGQTELENKVSVYKYTLTDTPWAVQSLAEATPRVEDGHEYFWQM